jgi:cell division septation protein DedD
MKDSNDGILERQIDPSRQPLFPGGALNSSGRFLLLVILLCVLFGAVLLALISFLKPEVKRPSWVGQRIRLPIPSIEREEKPPVFKPPEPQTGILGEDVAEKVRVMAEKEVSKEEKGVAVAEVKAKKPGVEGEGQGKTRVAVVEEPKGPAKPEGELPKGLYTVNIASFRKRDRAQRLIKELEGKGYEAFVEEANIPQKGTWYRVAVGRFSSRKEALAFARELKEQGIDYSFVRKLRE